MLTEGVRYDLLQPIFSVKTGPGNHNHRHCEARQGRGNLLYHVATPIAPINIVHLKFSMLTYISAHPTSAVEIATPSARNDEMIWGSPSVRKRKRAFFSERSFSHGDPYGNRTHVTAVKGRCLDRLTNGPGSGDLT